MTDVLLTHSYHLFYDAKQVRKMQPYPPLGTLYAAALLRAHGFSVALFDAMLEDPATGFPAALARHRPSIVAVYEDSFNFLSKMCLTRMREVAFAMQAEAAKAGAVVVANGSDASDHVAEYLERGFDYVLLGEAEFTLLELTTALRQGGPTSGVQGMAFRCPRTGSLIRTPPRPLLQELDKLPDPARDLIDTRAYREAWKSSHGYFSLNLVASRGCPYLCNWCAKPIYGDSFHVRSADSVAREMLELKEAHRAEHLWFADDVFGLQRRWVSELAECVERYGARIPFKIQTRVNLVTAETASALKRAGCTEVWMGVESGSQKVLDAMDKGTRVEQAGAAREQLRRQGIRACFFLQFGYPGEDWNDIQQTIDLVRRTRPDDIGVSVSYPLPGTRFYQRVRQELGEKTNWVDSDDLSIMFRGAYTNEFYRALRDALHAEVDSWRLSAPAASGRKGGGALPPHPVTVASLWERVRQMEKTCRNTRLGSQG